MPDIIFDNIRTQQKYEEESVWNTGTEFVPLRGEIIVYGPDAQHAYPRVKIGDAAGKKLSELPFLNDRITEEELDQICI